MNLLSQRSEKKPILSVSDMPYHAFSGLDSLGQLHCVLPWERMKTILRMAGPLAPSTAMPGWPEKPAVHPRHADPYRISFMTFSLP
jgi:hypothetical protein